MFIEFINKINLGYNITDMAVDLFNDKIILTGEKTLLFDNNRIIKFSNVLSNSKMICYTKGSNQLFFTTEFLIVCRNGKVYKCNSIRTKKKELIFELPNYDILATNNSTLIYVIDDNLYLREINTNRVVSTKINFDKTVFYDEVDPSIFNFKLHSFKEYLFKIIYSGGHIILKIRKENCLENVINIYTGSKLRPLFSISTINTHILSKIIGIEYYAINNLGELEIWDIITSELKDVKIIKNQKITYFDEVDGKYYIATSKGEFFIKDKKFNDIEESIKITNHSIKKFIILNNKIRFIDDTNNLIVYKIREDEK